MVKKTAFVTGDAEGVGVALSRSLSDEGYTVHFCDVTLEKERQRLDILRNEGAEAHFHRLDARDHEWWKKVAAELHSDEIFLDLLVNNAGIADPFMEFTSENTGNWSKVLETNLMAIY